MRGGDKQNNLGIASFRKLEKVSRPTTLSTAIADRMRAKRTCVGGEGCTMHVSYAGLQSTPLPERHALSTPTIVRTRVVLNIDESSHFGQTGNFDEYHVKSYRQFQ